MEVEEAKQSSVVFSAIIEDDTVALGRLIAALKVSKLGVVSWSIGKTEQAGLCRLTLEVQGGPSAVRQCCCQVAKLVSVFEMERLSDGSFVGLCHALVRVEAIGWKMREAHDRLTLAEARILSVEPGSIVVQLCAQDEDLDALLHSLRMVGKIECVRTGLTAIRK